MKTFALGLGLAGMAAGTAAGTGPPASHEALYHVRIQRANSPAVEMLLLAGEAAQLRNRTTGETLELLLHRTPRESDAAFVEVFRSHPDRAYIETIEVVQGERATTQRLPVPLTVELVAGPQP